MQPKVLTWISAIGLALAATPALAQTSWYGAPPSFFYQGPDGSYDSYGDLTRSIRGVPCGVECTHRAAVRWGLIPGRQPYYHGRYHERY